MIKFETIRVIGKRKLAEGYDTCVRNYATGEFESMNKPATEVVAMYNRQGYSIVGYNCLSDYVPLYENEIYIMQREIKEFVPWEE